MFILTDKDDVVLHISETLNRQEGTNYYLINNDTLAIPTQFVKESYEVEEVGEEITPRKYCYTEKKGFFENKDYVEPERDMTNKEIREKLAELQAQIDELKKK